MNKKSIRRKTILHDRSGIAAVEFALIAPIFFALVFSLFEAGWLITKTALLENAVERTGRDIYTGAALADATITPATLIQEICDNVLIIQNCMNNITLDVRTISFLGTPPSDDAVCSNSSAPGFNPIISYNPGASSEISFVRVCLTTDLFTPFLGLGLALPKNGDGRYEIVSSIAFANEPF